MTVVSRRTFLLSSAALVASAYVPAPSAQGRKSLTVVSWGGPYQRAQSQAVWRPAAKALGIELVEETYNGLADLRLRVRSNSVNWDVVSIGAGGAARASAEKLLEPLDYDVIDVSTFFPGYHGEHWVAGDLYSTALAWNTEVYKNAAPASWADFWDVERFPGHRAYRNQALGHLEPALMADGVAPQDVYTTLSTDEGLKRAIDKVARLKQHIAAFWGSGAQQAQLLNDGAVDMASAWTGQIAPLMKAGRPIAMTYAQGMLDADCYVVPLGAPHRELAMAFLNEASKAQYQAAFSMAMPYGAANEAAYGDGLIPAEVAATLPSSPENLAKQLRLDAEWWRDNQARAEKLYQEMISR
ncbi:ABC transporter substrate-binding protein [Verticiella sediminum]|uniref:ABC transporter substrate-binding protein n=1 Tax=Verticiella sediminum TaxID=1247510 RepID=A0A556AU03_9BURK|nr:ABC transporter substrate-binding protein [Verticiella sediminum]TSH96423.1 ABC transporter substrate-binding protein [Verticiella sediminum]